MQKYMMNFDSRKLPQLSSDCLIVGAGVAGLIAAWYAAERGCRVMLAVKDTLQDSNTNKAQGGIAAVFAADDDTALHAADTLTAGAGICDESIVHLVVEEGRQQVKELMELGAVFDHRPDGRLALGREGCHSRARILHAQGDATGAEVVRSLLARVEAHRNITICEHSYVADLLVTDGCCRGALLLHNGKELGIVRSTAVILATGGCGRLYRHTTNPEGATGSGCAIAYRAGAELTDMEFIQFHPTALALPGCPNFLISEAVRGAGALLLNARGQRFMTDYHELAELAPRDVVARAIFHEMGPEKNIPVYLDAAGVAAVADKFPMIAATCRTYGVDIAREPIPIAPAAHYMMGGIRVDDHGRTNISGLFACGETACTGLHGANRLASNSLLEGLVFGRRAAETIGGQVPALSEEYWHYAGQGKSFTVKDIEELQNVMTCGLGIVRDAGGLKAAKIALAGMQVVAEGTTANCILDLEYRNMLQTASLIVQAAEKREESRGAHYRLDYPQRLKQWRHHIIESAGAVI
ncbi:MAG: L-aspartate oxidase [Selenomonadaceae bacterium]